MKRTIQRDSDNMQSSLLEAGLAYHETGQLAAAQAFYREILEIEPDNADALHLFGVAEHQAGRHAQAIAYISHAIAINPKIARYYSNLGAALQALQLFDEARDSIMQSLALNPASADSHYNLGVILAAQGDQINAELHFRQAISLQANLTQAHFNLGILLQHAHRLPEAVACFQQVLRIDPTNGVAQFLSASLSGQNMARAPDQYITTVFDADADTFDVHLLDSLQYDTPQRLLGLCLPLLQNRGESHDLLDLGCGTGLVAVSFAEHTRHMVGIDLSANMLVQARRRGLYQRLEQGEMLVMMEREAGDTYDIVVAADVFIYWGALASVFAQAKRLLRTGGIFTFSVEALETCTGIIDNRLALHDYQLHVNGRFAHSAAYLESLASEYGFRVKNLLSAPARLEGGKAVLAWLALLEK